MAITPKPAPTDAQIAELAQTAREVSERAYAPYSKFHVGAAVLDEQGRIFSGCNVENASYGLTICAERNAIAAAVAAGAKSINAVAVFTPQPVAIPPCGACRQVLSEFGQTMHVYLTGPGIPPKHYTLDELLPAQFTPDQLVKSHPA